MYFQRSPLPWRWDQRDLAALLCLEPVGERGYSSFAYDINPNGRVHAGQLLGQALWAAAQTVKDRAPSLLQLTFLQGARPEQPIEYSVESLQQARRLSTCQVCAVQGTGMVASAHVSFHSAQAGDGSVCREWATLPAPEQLPTLAEWARAHPLDRERMALRLVSGPILDVRPVDPEGCFGSPGATRQTAYWMRLTQPLTDEGCLQQAALAYMSACGFNAGLEPGHYLSDLNHSLWFHSAKVDTAGWLLFVSEPASSLGARQLVFTHIYDRQGVRVASMSRETLSAPLAMA